MEFPKTPSHSEGLPEGSPPLPKETTTNSSGALITPKGETRQVSIDDSQKTLNVPRPLSLSVSSSSTIEPVATPSLSNISPYSLVLKEGNFELYLGTKNVNHATLQSLGITRVVSVAAEYPFPRVENSAEEANLVRNLNPESKGEITYNGITYYNFSEENLVKLSPIAFELLKECRDNQEKVFIHCEHGAVRSATAVAYYLMKNEGKSMEEAINYLKMVRPGVEPNATTLKMLKKLKLGGGSSP